MAKSLNKVMLIGRLGKDPDIRQVGNNGTTLANLSVATSESKKNNHGDWEEHTEWHRVTVWGRQADAVAEYLSKGSQVYIEGKLQTRQYEDKDGNQRYTTEIVAWNVIFLGGGSGQGAGTYNKGSRQQTKQQQHEDKIPF